MTLLNDQVTHVRAGYDEISDAPLHLKRQWRSRLLAAYSQKRQVYAEANAAYQARFQVFERRTWEGLIIVGGLLILATLAFLINTWMGSHAVRTVGIWLLTGGCLAALPLALLRAWYWRQRPQPPLHPLHANLFPPLLPAWKQALIGQLPSTTADFGAIGEYDFIHHLQQKLDDSHYIISRLRQKQGDDVDVTVVGPSGLWVFEVKYWSGRIVWQNGQWQHEKNHRNNASPSIITQPPDEQWRRMTADVARSIQYRAPQLVSRFLTHISAKGGVVFTHKEATYAIAPGCPAAWGNIATWERRLVSAPKVPGWDERVTLTVLDALLARHHQVVEPGTPKSMHQVSQQLVAQTEKRLASWHVL